MNQPVVDPNLRRRQRLEVARNILIALTSVFGLTALAFGFTSWLTAAEFQANGYLWPLLNFLLGGAAMFVMAAVWGRKAIERRNRRLPPDQQLSLPPTGRRALFNFALMLWANLMMFAVSWSLVYQILSLTAPSWIARAGELVVQLVDLLLSLLVLFGLLAPFARVFTARAKAMAQPLIEAMTRIARGDFSVKVQINTEGRGDPFDHIGGNLNQMADSLKHLETMRQEFVSSVSHEIQSPLNAISGFATALADDDLVPDERRRYLQIIRAESGRLSRLADNLLKLSSLDSQARALSPTDYRLDAQIRSVVLNTEPLWAAKDLELGLDLPQAEIRADEDLLTQVWTNILHNAIKFTPKAGRISLTLTVEAEGHSVVVRDTGAGIDPINLPRVGDRFFTGDLARSQQSANHGSGLGLAIVQKIVQLHLGSVTVSSPGLGQGTAVRVWLPKHPWPETPRPQSGF